MEEGYDQMSDVCLRAGWRGPEWMSLNPGIWEEWVHCLATPGVTLRMQRVKESERGCKRIQEELVSLGCWVFFFNKFIHLFIFGCGEAWWLHTLSLVAASGGYSSLRYTGFSLRWLLVLRNTGSRHAGFSSCGLRALECRLSSCGSRA